MKKYVSALLAVVLLLSLSLTGCGNKTTSPSSDSKPEESTPSTTEESTEKKDTLVIAQGSDLITFDPANHLASSTDSIIDNMASSLLKYDKDMNITMDLATEYSMVDDTTWAFTIRDDVTFQNGDKLTAEDVKFSLERAALDTSLLEFSYWNVVDHVDVIDETHLNVVTVDPYPALPSLLCKSGGEIVPKNYIETNGLEYFLEHPIFSGAYQLESRVKDDRTVLVPYEGYYGDKAIWKEVVFRYIPESSTRVGELLTGNVDIITDVPTNEWDRVNDNEGSSIIMGDTSRVYALAMKMPEGFPASDARVREAVELAIDKEMLCTQLLKGAGVPTQTRVAPGIVGFNESLYNTNIYNPERAKELLAEAGYPDGFTLHLLAPRGRYLMDAEFAQMVAGMLEQVGIKVELEITDFSVFSEKLAAKENEGAILVAYGAGFFDGIYCMQSYTPVWTTGETDYVNDDYMAIYDHAIANMNLEERTSELEQLQEIVAGDRPYIQIAHIKTALGVNDRLNFQPTLDESMDANNITLK